MILWKLKYIKKLVLADTFKIRYVPTPVYSFYSKSKSVSQPRLREGLIYHPCNASFLPLNAVYIPRKKKIRETSIYDLYSMAGFKRVLHRLD